MTAGERAPTDEELIAALVSILDALGPFDDTTRRSEKWRTSRQLEKALAHTTGVSADAVRIEGLLSSLHEAELKRVESNKKPTAPVRRAMRPDLWTAERLWGSTRHLGPVWKGFPKNLRTDMPGTLRRAAQSAADAPIVFLSHSFLDTRLALALRDDMNKLGIEVWLAQINIDYGGDIVECVRQALHECDACVGLVTPGFLASLWCRTELHTNLTNAYPSALVIDASNHALLDLVRHTAITAGTGDEPSQGAFDSTRLKQLGQSILPPEASEEDLETYVQRASGFGVHLPAYLGGRKAVAYPTPPEGWTGPIGLTSLEAFAKCLRMAKS